MKYLLIYGGLYLLAGFLLSLTDLIDAILKGRIDPDNASDEELIEIGHRMICWPKYLVERDEEE